MQVKEFQDYLYALYTFSVDECHVEVYYIGQCFWERRAELTPRQVIDIINILWPSDGVDIFQYDIPLWLTYAKSLNIDDVCVREDLYSKLYRYSERYVIEEAQELIELADQFGDNNVCFDRLKQAVYEYNTACGNFNSIRDRK